MSRTATIGAGRGRRRDAAAHQRPRPRRARRRAVAGPAAGVHGGGGPLARARHRGQHRHLQPRQRRHPPRLARRAARGGGQPLSPPDVFRVQHALLPRLRGCARRHRRGLQRHRGRRVRAGAGGPRRGRRGRRGAGRGGHRRLLPDAGHRGRGRAHPAAERRRLARRASGRHARLPLLARRLRRRPRRGRTRDARRRPGLHGPAVASGGADPTSTGTSSVTRRLGAAGVLRARA